MDKKKSFTHNAEKKAKTALDLTKAKAQETKGVIKETTGKVTDNPKLTAEGKVDQIVGKTKAAVARVKDAARDAVKKGK
jgi:uncharacterized protein YjbJ (UPF0337 family)